MAVCIEQFALLSGCLSLDLLKCLTQALFNSAKFSKALYDQIFGFCRFFFQTIMLASGSKVLFLKPFGLGPKAYFLYM